MTIQGLLAPEPGWDYGEVLPLASRQGPKGPEMRFAMPGMVRNLLMGFGDLAEQKITPQGTLTPNALMSLSAMPFAGAAPANSLGMFMGRTAKNADMGALLHAQKLEELGSGKDLIHQTTGWFRGPDGQWRWELSDHPATFGDAIQIEKSAIPATQEIDGLLTGKKTPAHFSISPDSIRNPVYLDQVLDHPELFANYPDLAKTRVLPENNFGYSGSFDAANNLIRIGGSRDPETVLSILLHEVQHGVQNQEGFASGGNIGQFLSPNFVEQKRAAFNDYQTIVKELEKGGVNAHAVSSTQQTLASGTKLHDETRARYTDLINKATETGYFEKFIAARDRYNNLASQEQSAQAKYKSLSGEIEARLTQARQRATPADRLENPPWSDGGFISPEEQLIQFSVPSRLPPNATRNDLIQSARRGHFLDKLYGYSSR